MSNVPQLESPQLFLDEAYKSLGFEEAKDALLNAVSYPEPGTNEEKAWLEKGDWLTLAHRVGADKVFFVRNDPVVVFCALETGSDNVQALLEKFRRVWCMARPQCLFIALLDELHVYRLDRTPTRDAKKFRKDREIGLAKSIKEVAEKLHAFRREQIESGYLVKDKYFGGIDQRADKRLIQDLKSVRRDLLDTGLEAKYAHALIGRSIFIRYLEDRGIIDEEYLLERVVKNNLTWQAKLQQETYLPDFAPDNERRRYYRVLVDKPFTYALFRQLMNDFNGDMFPDVEEEEKRVTSTHLELLQGFLLGDTDKYQRPLFLWAYDFEVIPIELISNIYEEFYHKENTYRPDRQKQPKHSKRQDDVKTHYTPGVLVEYVLSNLLSQEHLATNPKILDPACGSGIFLVESFRRIVRYSVQRQKGEMLSPNALRKILREQIRGIEINEEAVHIAAFSLYLALLHYQEPPAIRAHKLPNLIYKGSQPEDEDHYHVLFRNNTFALIADEREQLNGTLSTFPEGKKRDEYEKLLAGEVLPVGLHSYDIIVGNPPWGFEKGATREIQEAQEQEKLWGEYFNWSIGDREPSQSFIARSLSLLKLGGECGLLISTGVFLKHQNKSKEFRERWLEETTIKTVVNFAHVRHAFFNMDANAPFAFVHYIAQAPFLDHWVQYLSVKRTTIVDKTQAIVLGQPDIRQMRQSDLQYNDFLWKVYWWGNHRDAALIKALRLNMTIDQLAKFRNWPKSGSGFTPTGHKPSNWLKKYEVLPTKYLIRYGPINPAVLKPAPDFVYRRGSPDLQTGWRLLIGQGVSEAKGINGIVEARLENLPYCFTNSIHGVNVDSAEEWERKVLIGIAWSSLARYYYFMTASSWGTWHHQLHLGEAMSLPIRFPQDAGLRNEIVNVVDDLMNWSINLLSDTYEETSLERKLDKAIFELYKLGEAERDLILDLCEVNLEFLYRHNSSIAARTLLKYPLASQGTIKDLPAVRENERGLEGYLYAFLEMWNRQLATNGEFCWHVIRPSNESMLAVVFTTQEVGDTLPTINSTDDEEWFVTLDRCSEVLMQPVSRNIYIDSMVRVVTDTEIYIIKRDERRLWTRSMAREDAEATFVRAMCLQEEAMKETV